ncbi:uncharacterized protein BXZ73DRAFT_99927 [Epithele typhae]|uniref:uncharacterized protein n=1 Tax=Epithele typhae TaxID=378194 RepID=UPI002007601D|nr:uncharacterized protein BXZ73DRAFT_99927 [Epithele typhae]KAH9938865.1 hypothetical protein BXZ73DRAFT_99927 [Epithele typhae]
MKLLWSWDGGHIFAQDAAADVHVYDALTFKHLRTLSPPDIYKEMSGDQVPRPWDHNLHRGSLTLSADGRYLLSNVALPTSLSKHSVGFRHNSICVWTLATGSCEAHFLRQYHDGPVPEADTYLYATALRQDTRSPGLEHRAHVVVMCENGTLLTAAVGSPDGVTTIRPAGFPADLGLISHALFSSDGMRVLVVKFTVTFLVLDTLTGATIASLDSGRYPTLCSGPWLGMNVVLSGDGRVAAIPSQRWMFEERPEWWLWRLEDGMPPRKMLGLGGTGPASVGRCALSWDGSVAGFAAAGGDVFFRNVEDS